MELGCQYDRLLSNNTKFSLIGLNYVSMPIAVAFAKKVSVVGFDLNEKKLSLTRIELIQHVRLGTMLFEILQLTLLLT